MKKCKYCQKELDKSSQKFYCSKNCSNKGTANQNSLAKMGKNNPLYGKIPWNKGIPRTEEQKIQHSLKMKEYYNTNNKSIGFQKGNTTKTQFKKGHVPWSNGKKMNDIFKTKVSDSKKLKPWKPTKEQKDKMRFAKLGEKSSNWKGGITDKNSERFRNYEWREIAQRIRKKYNFICQKCGKKPSTSVHHIIPWNICKSDQEENLILYCKSCHMKVERKINKLFLKI